MRFLMAATAAALASCASPPAPSIRLAIAPFEVLHADFRGEPVLSSRDADKCLQDRLAASGRFTILERRNIEALIQAMRRGDASPGSLSGADWVAYGTLDGKVPWHSEAPPGSSCTAEVIVQLRVARVEDGVIIYSKTHRGTAKGVGSGAQEMFLNECILLNEANRIAVSKLADDLASFRP
jgi:curli biogenesis system outer membrane secretion channel CsgG